MKLRTYNCGELRKKDEGADVKLIGWVATLRHHGKVAFINLRDRYGITQIVVKEEKLLEEINAVGSEWIISVDGKVVLRPQGMENKDLSTGEIDVEANKVEVISRSKVPIFVITDEVKAKEDLRLKYRYLDLRRPTMQKAIILKSKLEHEIRAYLHQQDFVSVETPILGKATPEGARDFLVPSRLHPGKFYSLVQSPQIYKQLLMVAAFDKYYQFARCFRDEDLRKDRQLEHTQLDIECSFVTEEDIFNLMEGLMQKLLKKVMNIDLTIPFKRMTYYTAIESYGSDKPDIRYGLKLQDVTELSKTSDFNIFKSSEAIKCIVWDGDLSRKVIDELTNVAKEYTMGLFWLKYNNATLSGPLAKFFTPEAFAGMSLPQNAVILFSAGEKKRVCETLGGIRNALIKTQLASKPNEYEFLWVTDFPMFEINPETQTIAPAHHIFTMPKNPEALEREPLSTIGRLYDLVLNGVELCSGSIRVHKRELQEKLLEIIGSDKESREKNFGFLLEALEYGAPPHGGIAMGFDRFVTLLLGEESIHNVIAFPKTLAGIGLLEEIPSEIPEAQLDELHIKIKEKNKNEQA